MHERARATQPDMERCSNSVRGWSNSMGLESSCMSSPFFQDSMPGESKARSCSHGGQIGTDQVLQGGFETMKANHLEPTWRGGFVPDSLLRSGSNSMVDSNGILTTDDHDAGLCSASSEQMNVGNLVIPQSASSGAPCLQQLESESSVRLQFCMAPEGSAGPLSRRENEGSLGEQFFNANSCGGLGSSRMGLKRRPDDADEQTWMHQRAQKSPKILLQDEKPLVFQEHSAAYGVPPSFGASSYLNTQGHADIASAVPGSATQSASLFAPTGPVLSHEIEQGDRDLLPSKLASMRAILFRASLPLATAAEIESSRPKRRNVKISKDPQSVAARHRRERISDRIRVLQRLVPGGTKMDTASMLDEAIHYVKYLKLQLQTLEQLGNGACDPRYNVAMMGLQSSPLSPAARAFDLNCTVYNQVPSSCELAGATSVKTMSLSSDSLAASHISSGVWPSTTSISRPFGGLGQFPDPLQEQFCH